MWYPSITVEETPPSVWLGSRSLKSRAAPQVSGSPLSLWSSPCPVPSLQAAMAWAIPAVAPELHGATLTADATCSWQQPTSFSSLPGALSCHLQGLSVSQSTSPQSLALNPHS